VVFEFCGALRDQELVERVLVVVESLDVRYDLLRVDQLGVLFVTALCFGPRMERARARGLEASLLAQSQILEPLLHLG